VINPGSFDLSNNCQTMTDILKLNGIGSKRKI